MAKVNLGNRLVPLLFVHDMQQTLAFYKKLGFTLTGCHPDQSTPVWAEVRRDSVVFQFYIDLPCDVEESPLCSGTYYIYPDSVAALARELFVLEIGNENGFHCK